MTVKMGRNGTSETSYFPPQITRGVPISQSIFGLQTHPFRQLVALVENHPPHRLLGCPKTLRDHETVISILLLQKLLPIELLEHHNSIRNGGPIIWGRDDHFYGSRWCYRSSFDLHPTTLLL